MKKALIAANLGGFASFLLSDIELLQKMDFEVHYMANCNVLPWDDTKKKLEKMNVVIHNVCIDSKNPYKLSNIFEYNKIKKFIKNEKFQLIHCHTPIIGLIVRLAAKRYRNNCKIIYTTHGFSFNSYSSRKKWFIYYNLEKIFSKYCDAIVTINKEDYLNAKSMKCNKVYYINGVGVDVEKYKKKPESIVKYRESINVGNSEIMILSVGELSERKNHQIIIKAISKIKNKNDYVYVICGNGINGGLGKQLEELSKKLGVKLLLLGYRNDIPEIINCSDIGAIPSVREGLGLAGIQSLAAGVPLVASNVQGIKDYVVDNETGFLADPFDDEKFASSIIKLSDINIRNRMKKECIKTAEKFDIKISKKQMEKIYKELLFGVDNIE